MPKNAKNYHCELCDFSCSKQNNYSVHLLTAKHKKRTNSDICDSTPLCCEFCNKTYKSRNGLWSHNKKCKSSKKCQEKCQEKCHTEEIHDHMTDKALIMQLLKQNNELTQKVLEIANTPNINNSIINNNHNKHFNVNVFLNETCKNAMNMDDFINSLKIESNELENVGKLGYVEGISNIFIRGLKELDETERPMHCMDKKRETLYIKDGDVWNKDDKQDNVKKVIGQIAHKNFMKLIEWKEENPQWENTETKKHAQYVEIVKQVFSVITPDDNNGINKIIRKLANEVCVDKNGMIDIL